MADREGLRRQLIDLLTDLFVGTDMAPSEGGLIVDAVVVMGWVEGSGEEAGISWFGANNGTWVSEGLLRDALRDVIAVAGGGSDDHDD